MKDNVNNPEHYKTGGIETIDFLEAKLGPIGFKAYCRGNALKYLSRAGKKDNEVEDIKKAIWYLNREVQAHEKEYPENLPNYI